jgi:hypothetical protein
MPRSYSEEEIQEIVAAVESADTAFRAGNFAIAEEIYSQALPLLEQAIGKDDPDTLSCLQNLGDCCFGVEAYADAIRHYEKLVNTHERVFGASHQNTIAVLLKLAKAYGMDGRQADADRAMQAASDRTHVPVSDLLDTADRVIDDARHSESDRNAQRKQLEELQRSTQAFQQLKMPTGQPLYDDVQESQSVEFDSDQNTSQKMHRPSAHRLQASDLRRVADVAEEQRPEPGDWVGVLKAKAPIIVPVVGVILVIGLIVFIWLSLPSSAPPTPRADIPAVKAADEKTAPIETYYQTPDSQEVLKLDGDQADLVIGKDTAKCPVVHIGSSWLDIFQILVGPFTGTEIWFIETPDGLTRENGPKYYGKNSPESVVINEINAVARRASSWYTVSRKYPVSPEELQSSEVMYTNPISKVPSGPVLGRYDRTEADIKEMIDGSSEQTLEEAFRHVRKSALGVKTDSTGLWKEEAKPKPCSVHCATVLVGADTIHYLFFVHGFDRHGYLLRAATNYPEDVFLISLKDGTQTKFEQPNFLEKPPVRQRRIVILKPPDNMDTRLVHFIWPLIFAVLAALSVACTGFESAADGERKVGVLPKGTAVKATWVFVALCFASMIALVAP